jgi:hypothetical protein
MDKRTGLTVRLIASSLCAALLLVSPGPCAYAAVGQVASIKVSAPVGMPMGRGNGSLNAGISNGIKTPLSLTAVTLSSKLIPGQAAPAVTVQDLSALPVLPLAPSQESPAAVAETIAAPVAIPLLASPAAEEAAAPAEAQAGPAAQAQSIAAAPGRLEAPASRVKTGVLKTLRAIFSSSKAEASLPVAGQDAAAVAPVLSPSAATELKAATVEPAAPSSPAAAPESKLRKVLRWAMPILAVTALVYGLDIGTKYLAAKFIFTAFHECAWRAPLLAGIIPYIGLTAFIARRSLPDDHKVWRWSGKQLRNGKLGFYRVEVSGLDKMMKEHPSLKWALRVYDLSIAMMLGGMLGNGIDAFRLGGALDWIPLGRSLMNFADVALLWGLAFFQLASSFFFKASEAHQAGKPLQFSTTGFLGLPLLGFFIAWAFGSAAGGGEFDLAMKGIGYLYLMGFSMLLGISRFLAALVVDRFAKKFKAGQGVKPKA